ncbi:polysaccharide export protein [Methylomonas sp. SURF-2]|uniref:Polysaccharide export protein n=1 Tax=Methylomonas subterranea TaxID=2952225 RepID=A0ABT1TLP8_9GAMM|nr:polysaccharide biosynthesis/export family protein [Methylomonas sp. SURF-2]MCQ8106394.1 polysaccharide export protein [Methylomonas sp. SURF-2]
MKQQLISFLIFAFVACNTFAQTEFPLNTTALPQTQSETAIPQTADKTDVVVLKDPETLATYLLSPGDAVEVTVWKEEGLQQQQFLIGPDGNIVYPLIGTITAAGRTINDLKELVAVKLADFIADPSVSVKLLNNQGNAIFVIGKVNKPGQVFAGRRLDVLQALSLAGGLTVFADESNINIQRRVGNEIKVFPFDYGNVMDGEDLQQNILLEPGDTITVP